jgi:cyclopropane fatty-acyl-phospholipid synthase-like methyltransferase
MGWNDHMDDEGYDDFLREVLDSGRLDGPASGILRLVLDKGERVLSEKQQHVFQKYITETFVTEKCKRCGANIPWSEMFEAHDNGGYCSWCVKMMSNKD